jgi:hypothetical protein
VLGVPPRPLVGAACGWGVGLWVGLTEEVEVPGWFLGFAYAGLSGLGIALGVFLRRKYAARRITPRS